MIGQCGVESTSIHEDACDVEIWGSIFNTIAAKHDECAAIIEKLQGNANIEAWYDGIPPAYSNRVGGAWGGGATISP